MYAMKPICLCSIVFSFASAFALEPEVRNFRAPVQTPREVVEGFVWVEAEGFSDYGNWRLDTQFVHKMGSGYLLAAGVLKPIGSARTWFDIPSPGKWTVWSRTKDWLPEWHPGTFRVSVNGQPGETLGDSGQEGWRWERAGCWELDKGPAEVSLDDLSGAFARCDALLFTRDGGYVPPDGDAECAAARARFTGTDPRVADGGEYEFVVVGAGPGGISAAIAAARHGARVLLVHDRPVLGGNASSEIGVPTDGAAISHMNAREGGICEEANLARVGGEKSFSDVFRQMTEELPNLTVRGNSRVERVEKSGDTITSVLAHDTLTGAWTRYRGKLFLDGTGDGWIGYFADAELLHGREARSEYGEYPAPEKGDALLMSGCLMGGNYLGYSFHSSGRGNVPFVVPEWARVLPPDFDRWTTNGKSQWWVEHGGRFDELSDPERARDELVRINLAYWGWLKNEWKFKDRLADQELCEMPHMNGRREGYRIRGDYLLTGNDCLEGRMFDDRISYGGWPLDRHDPLGIDNPTGNGYCDIHPDVPIYSIPFRILYSRNVPNLMMAGRNVSATHVALGTVRVESTIMTMGQAAGTAAAFMIVKKLLPREYGADGANIRELQQTLLKDDQYIPGLANNDESDLARKARVAATSVSKELVTSRTRSPLFGLSEDRVELDGPRATCWPVGYISRIAAFECMLESTSDRPVGVRADVFSAADISGEKDTMKLVGTAEAVVPEGHRGPVRFEPEEDICVAGPYVWVRLSAAEQVWWRMMGDGRECGLARSFGKDGFETVEKGRGFSFTPESGDRKPIETKPEYVIDGVSRQVDSCTHCWISDPNLVLPQSLTLTLPSSVIVSEIRLTFDSDLNPLHPAAHPSTLVRSYIVEGEAESGARVLLADVSENIQRHRVHAFRAQAVKAVMVTVRSTWGDPSARVFEVRLY